MQCTALVIDDEPLARKRMISLLEPYSSEIEILGEAGSGAQAVKMIHEMMPDVVFLDIRMPDMVSASPNGLFRNVPGLTAAMETARRCVCLLQAGCMIRSAKHGALRV